MKCCKGPISNKFGLSILGVFICLILTLVGALPPYNRVLIPFPLAWALAVIVLLPSLVLYYSVRDRFWAQFQKKT